jgi:hypothetical protein
MGHPAGRLDMNYLPEGLLLLARGTTCVTKITTTSHTVCHYPPFSPRTFLLFFL